MNEDNICPLCEKPIKKEDSQYTLVKANGKTAPLAHTDCWVLFCNPKEDVNNWKIRDDI